MLEPQRAPCRLSSVLHSAGKPSHLQPPLSPTVPVPVWTPGGRTVRCRRLRYGRAPPEPLPPHGGVMRMRFPSSILVSVSLFTAETTAALYLSSTYRSAGDQIWQGLTLLFTLVPSVLVQLTLTFIHRDLSRDRPLVLLLHILQLGPIVRCVFTTNTGPDGAWGFTARAAVAFLSGWCLHAAVVTVVQIGSKYESILSSICSLSHIETLISDQPGCGQVTNKLQSLITPTQPSDSRGSG